jgi:hypothetical protein
MIDVRRLETSKEPPKINHISSNAAVHDLRPLSLSLSLSHYYTGGKKNRNHQPVCVCVFLPPSATQKASQRSIPKFQRLHSFCARVFQGARKGVYQASVTPSSSLCCHCSCLRRPAAVYRIHSVISSSFASHGHFRPSRSNSCCCGESYTHRLECTNFVQLAFVCCSHLSVLFPSSLDVRFSYTTNDTDS